MRRITAYAMMAASLGAMALGTAAGEDQPMSWPANIQTVLDNTVPLTHPREGRLPLYLWPARDPGPATPEQAESLVRALDERGIGLVCSWNAASEESLNAGLLYARAQRKLGVPVNVDATTLMYPFSDGSPECAHLDADGQPFFDDTFGPKDMGCPFRLERRVAPMRDRMARYAARYARDGASVDFIFADWEVDGPLEWNRAWDASKRCSVCQSRTSTEDFFTYQNNLRRVRSRLQRLCFSEPILTRFPGALVGNYAVYPHDGWRYWYDYFERYIPGQPAMADQNAKYRHWANDFPETGYTFAMPVVYPWSWTWNFYDFEPGDYRWFYNGLLVASNAGRHTPAGTPIITFVHYHTVDVGTWVEEGPAPLTAQPAQQMSEKTYQELLWHMLLRGTDTFYLWCTEAENAKEVALLHPVWAAAQEYGDFLEKGVPVTFDVPRKPGPVVSGLRLGDKLLVRRTDFAPSPGPISLEVNGKIVSIPEADGECQILELAPE